MDIIAGILELIGLWKVGNKNKKGFLFNILCGLCWIAFVLTSKTAWGLLIVVIPALIINVRNYIKWNRKESDMPQLTVKDAIDAIEKLKKDIESGKIKVSCSCDNEVDTKEVDTTDLDQKLTALENGIKEIKKELREHIDLYNRHVQGLHINN